MSRIGSFFQKKATTSKQGLSASSAHSDVLPGSHKGHSPLPSLENGKTGDILVNGKGRSSQKKRKGDKPMESVERWGIEQATHLYGIQDWGAGYFSINQGGQVVVHPKKHKLQEQVPLYDLMTDLKERGIRTPILIRFMDIIDERIRLINECFKKAIQKYEYKSKYQGVYPIKVNQQRHLVEQIIQSGKPYHIGLECGSKPELLVALAMMHQSKGLLICNGFKDLKYVETALLSQKLGYNTVIVLEKITDLHLILSVAKDLHINPQIGVRVRLDSLASGRWKQSSGTQIQIWFNFC